ncbi:MAG: tRNA 4-thiouridine(8) synthase ThiI [Nitrospirae bacterium RBG_16_64_22]|nr:MAG: tRNA 4-thiouridine(8) synthase ThiI [Nitrospirae bacterium RBG_16_64_22]
MSAPDNNRAEETVDSPSTPTVAVVHYGELALKGKNRPAFISRLVRNIKTALAGCGVRRIRNLTGRIVLDLGPGADRAALEKRLRRVMGISNYSLGFKVPAEIGRMEEAVAQEAARHVFRSFRVATKRADKTFPLTSPEVNQRIGATIKARTGAAVDLSNAAFTIHLEILPGEAFYSVERLPGAGGLPAGISGRVAVLLSGGIDSPVAAYRMMKRGCEVVLVHFHAYPILPKTSQRKARELAEVLTRSQGRTRLFLVPFGDIQSTVVTAVPGPLRVVVYRRLMFRIAEEIARKTRATALVTGESLGQVASQTLSNLATIEAAATLPILRPLIGMDKQEISDEAARIGTFDISIVPDQDCCTLFTPKHPATRTTVREIEAAEAALDVPALVRQGAEGAEEAVIEFP